MADNPIYSNGQILPGPRKRNADRHAALKTAFSHLLADGTGGLHYLPGAVQLDHDEEGTVDGLHPTDLDTPEWADAFAPVLAETPREPLRCNSGTGH